MLLTRRQNGTLQRLLPALVRYLNEKLDWKLDSGQISSLFAMINGVNINLLKMAGRWGIEPEVINCFVGMMLAPFHAEVKGVAKDKKTIE